MIGRTRLVLALIVAAVVTPPLGLYQWIAVRTRLMDDRKVPRLYHRILLKLLGIRVRVTGEIAAARPLMIASNHISWTDIMVLGSLAELHFIARSDMASWPGIGTLARLQRSVFVERDQRRQSAGQARAIAERLLSGDPMVLFPEGTTGTGNRIQPFKSTLFAAAAMAREAGGHETIAIQPVAIAYTRLQGMPMGRLHRTHAAWVGDQTLVPHLAALLAEGAMDVEVHFGEAIEFGPGSDRKKTAREIEARVCAMMTQALRRPL